MEQDRLDYILAIIEEKNLTRAAEKLYISQSALTKYISRLENEMGAKLFDRSTIPIRLTEAGEIYVRRMTKIKQEQEIMKREMQWAEKQGSERPCYHLGIGFMRGHNWTPAIIQYFIKEFPDWNLEIHNATERVFIEQIRKNVIDLAIGAFWQEDDEIEYVPLYTEEAYFVFPRKWAPFCNLSADEATLEKPFRISEGYIASKPMFLSVNSGIFNDAVNKRYGIDKNGKEKQIVYTGNGIVTTYLASKGVAGAFWIDYRVSGLNEEGMPVVTPYREDIMKRLAFCTVEGNSPLERKICAYYNRNQDAEKKAVSEKLSAKIQELFSQKE